MHLAYQYVVLALMIAQATFTAKNLGIETPDPQHLVKTGVFPLPSPVFIPKAVATKKRPLPPRFAETKEGLVYNSEPPDGGLLTTENYRFSFLHGKLGHIWQLDPFGDADQPGGDARILNRYRKLAKNPALITTTEAYTLATNWLHIAGVDMGKIGQGRTEQVTYVDEEQPGKSIPLPLFYVKWYKSNDLIIEIHIDGHTKQPIAISIDDASLIQRSIPITNRDALLKLPDEEFKTYTDQQKEALIRKFSTTK